MTTSRTFSDVLGGIWVAQLVAPDVIVVRGTGEEHRITIPRGTFGMPESKLRTLLMEARAKKKR